MLQDGGCNCNCVNNNFAVAQPAAISGYVYYDANDNGQRDSGEPGIGGVTLSIIPINVVGTPPSPVQVVTNANGFYSATGLNPGTWEVVEDSQPAGYLDGVDRAGTPGRPGDQPGGQDYQHLLGRRGLGAGIRLRQTAAQLDLGPRADQRYASSAPTIRIPPRWPA